MGIEFCPLADEVGKLTDWLAVAVGLLAAVGTIWVASSANRTSQRAAEIAEEAKGISQQQHLEAVNTREANARIIGRLLLHEVLGLPNRLRALEKLLESAIDGDSGWGALRLLNATGELSIPLLPNAERVEDRIHALPDMIGADLATMISHTRDLVDAAKRVKDAIVMHEARAIGTKTTYSYAGNPSKPGLLLEHLRYMSTLAPSFASEFRQFVLPGIVGEVAAE